MGASRAKSICGLAFAMVLNGCASVDYPQRVEPTISLPDPSDSVMRAHLDQGAREILRVAERAPVLAVADTSHRTGQADLFFNSPMLVMGLKAQGKMDIFLEMRARYQPAIDKFFAGEISRSDLLSILNDDPPNSWILPSETPVFNEKFIDGLGLLRQAGMRVHCVDVVSGERILSEREKAFLGSLHNAALNNLPEDLALKLLRSEFPEEFDNSESIIKKLSESRDLDNQPIIDLVKARMGGNGAVIVYGAAHFKGRNDMNEMMGREQVVTLATYLGEEDLRKEGASSEDPPEFAYIFRENKVWRFTNFEEKEPRADVPGAFQPF